MLDENLPTFHFKPASDKTISNVVYFTQNGSEPAPEYVLRHADPAAPESRNRYGIALCDPYSTDVVYADSVVQPGWEQPTLSAAELRAQAQNGGSHLTVSPIIPGSFTVNLHNPDQSITVTHVPGGWNKNDSWEFEIPTKTFRLPSVSELDREQGVSASELVPRVMFRWKKDGRLSKDMTCFMTGTNVGGRKSKEPDITVALFKTAREGALTVYEPNLQRVDVEDRKGFEVALLLSAEVIKDLFLLPRPDMFNASGAPSTTVNGGRRKNSKPSTSAAPVAMSGALGNISASGAAARPQNVTSAANVQPGASSSAEIEAETRRLQAMVEKEEREREKQEKAEQKRIKKMLDEEDKELRRRQAEIDKETERLRKQYGMDGQQLPSSQPSSSSSPPLPPRNQGLSTYYMPPPANLRPPPPGSSAPWYGGPALPPRPVSAGPQPGLDPGPFGNQTMNQWWRGPAGSSPPPPQPQQSQGGRRRGGSGGGGGLNLQNPAASVSTFFGQNKEDSRKKVQKKRSMHW